MGKKEDVSQRDENQFFYERAFEGVRGPLNQLRAVVERNNVDAGRQTLLQRADLLLDGVDHFKRVHTIARNDDPTHRFFAILVQDARAKRVAELHIGNVLNVDRNSVWRGQYDVLNISRRLN